MHSIRPTPNQSAKKDQLKSQISFSENSHSSHSINHSQNNLINAQTIMSNTEAEILSQSMSQNPNQNSRPEHTCEQANSNNQGPGQGNHDPSQNTYMPKENEWMQLVNQVMTLKTEVSSLA